MHSDFKTWVLILDESNYMNIFRQPDMTYQYRNMSIIPFTQLPKKPNFMFSWNLAVNV